MRRWVAAKLGAAAAMSGPPNTYSFKGCIPGDVWGYLENLEPWALLADANSQTALSLFLPSFGEYLRAYAPGQSRQDYWAWGEDPLAALTYPLTALLDPVCPLTLRTTLPDETWVQSMNAGNIQKSQLSLGSTGSVTGQFLPSSDWGTVLQKAFEEMPLKRCVPRFAKDPPSFLTTSLENALKTLPVANRPDLESFGDYLGTLLELPAKLFFDVDTNWMDSQLLPPDLRVTIPVDIHPLAPAPLSKVEVAALMEKFTQSVAKDLSSTSANLKSHFDETLAGAVVTIQEQSIESSLQVVSEDLKSYFSTILNSAVGDIHDAVSTTQLLSIIGLGVGAAATIGLGILGGYQLWATLRNKQAVT
jgi:hypothetical protein